MGQVSQNMEFLVAEDRVSCLAEGGLHVLPAQSQRPSVSREFLCPSGAQEKAVFPVCPQGLREQCPYALKVTQPTSDSQK